MKTLIVCIAVITMIWALMKSGSDADKRIQDMLKKKDDSDKT